MYTCDYNGWGDMPEEEREAIEVFESGGVPSASAAPPIVLSLSKPSSGVLPRPKAA